MSYPRHRKPRRAAFRLPGGLWVPPKAIAWLLLAVQVSLLVGSLSIVQAQTDRGVQRQEDQLIRQFAPPPESAPPPVYQPQPEPAPAAPEPEPQTAAPAPSAPEPSPPEGGTPAPTPAPSPSSESAASKPTEPPNNQPLSQYVLEFNRSPVVGNGFRLRGTYAESRLGFTRPRNWNLKTVKALVRFQHSPALLANRSNLTVRVNGVSVGSTPLNRKQAQVGELLVNVPANLIQNYNDLTIVAQQQNNANGCSDPSDQTLWSEVLPDSKLLFGFQPKGSPLDFSSYPYPFFDDLNLDANQVAYLLPAQVNESWLTATARFQASMGRLADFRPIEAQLVKGLDQVPANQKLVIIGTPQEQPGLKSLKLPYGITNNQIVDGSKSALPDDVGLLMMTTTRNGGVPVLVVTGNGPKGIEKAMQFLLQPQQRKLGTGSTILVDRVDDIPSPSPRQWARYLPEQNSFKLADLKGTDDKPIQDVTVRGAYTPPMEVNFRALPDDRFKRGSSMTLYYSHSPQVNPRLSTVEVRLDGSPIGGQRLTSENGANRESFNVNLPENQVKPNSKLQVAFNLVPKEPGECGRVTDQQLWGTIHSDSGFNLSRETSVKLPDLKLLQAGYPFGAPQDLSQTAIALPDNPSNSEIQTLLRFSERLGRLSKADTVKLRVFTAGSLPEDVRKQANLVGIGKREKFPFPEAFQAKGFQLKEVFTRQTDQSRIQTFPDAGGVIKQVISPWNGDRVLLALTAQSDSGLDKVRDVFQKDSLFFQLKDDTAVVNTTDRNPSNYDPDAYAMSFFQEANQTRQLDNASPLDKVSRFLQENWYLLPTGIILTALLLYGVVQLYLKRVALGDKK